MSVVSAESLRLAFKRVFIKYYLELQSPGIADPTEAFSTCRTYLGALREQLGAGEFMRRLDDETTHLVGHIEQDLRHRLRGCKEPPSFDDLEDRVRECFEQALGHLEATSSGFQVE